MQVEVTFFTGQPKFTRQQIITIPQGTSILENLTNFGEVVCVRNMECERIPKGLWNVKTVCINNKPEPLLDAQNLVEQAHNKVLQAVKEELRKQAEGSLEDLPALVCDLAQGKITGKIVNLAKLATEVFALYQKIDDIRCKESENV